MREAPIPAAPLKDADLLFDADALPSFTIGRAHLPPLSGLDLVLDNPPARPAACAEVGNFGGDFTI
jgi:hypothetical protein